MKIPGFTKSVLARLLILIPGFFLLLLMLSGCGNGGNGGTQFLNIGTGGETGVYYPAGGAIAKIVSENNENLRMTASTSKGSIDNINSVTGGQIDFGFAQSDAQYNATNGQGAWDSPQENLRHVMSLYPEAITLVVATDAGIEEFADLAGKRVNLGQPGSGTRASATLVFENSSISIDDLARAESLAAKEAPRILQDNRLDAFFYTVGHPAGAFEEAMAGNRKLKFLSIPNVAQIAEKYPFMQPTTIRKALYPRAEGGDAETVGLTTTIITSSDLAEDTVYNMVKAVIENIDILKNTHPALSDLTPEKLARPGSAPFHPGAEKYYREAGLLNADD